MRGRLILQADKLKRARLPEEPRPLANGDSRPVPQMNPWAQVFLTLTSIEFGTLMFVL